MYPDGWHARHRQKTRIAAQRILSILEADFEIGSILDVGCGHGDWLQAAMDLGITDVYGCDGPWIDTAQLVIPQDRFHRAVLDRPLDFGRSFELALSTEVGEHVACSDARHLVQTLASHADLVFFGAAIPQQGGYRHINEQWQSWWAAQFQEHGLIAFDLVRPLIWDEPIDFWYKQNGIVYVRATRDDLLARAEAAVARQAHAPVRFDIVHPDHYKRIAQYESIAFRPFLRNFPAASWRKFLSMVKDR